LFRHFTLSCPTSLLYALPCTGSHHRQLVGVIRRDRALSSSSALTWPTVPSRTARR
jgi:hypothetical protein